MQDLGTQMGDAAGQVLQEIRRLVPGVAARLTEDLHKPFSSYLLNAPSPVRPPVSEACIFARETLVNVMARRVSPTGNPKLMEEFRSEFNDQPFINTAPHCQFFVERNTLYSVFLSWARASILGSKFAVVSSTANIKLSLNKPFGANQLPLGGGSVKLFSVPRKDRDATVLSLQSEVRLDITELNKLVDAGDEPSASKADFVRSLVPQNVIGSAREAIAAFNDTFLNQVTGQSGPRLIIYDDILKFELFRNHLVQSRSIMSRIIFGYGTLARLEREMGKVRRGPFAEFLPRSESLLWIMRDGKSRPTTVTESHVVDLTDATFKISLKQDAITQAVESGVLLPGMFLYFLMCSILPRVVVGGGMRQIGYYSAYYKLAADFLSNEKIGDAAFYDDLMSGAAHCLWMFVVDCFDDPLDEIIRSSDTLFPRMLQSLLGQSLTSAARDFEIFRSYGPWSALLAAGCCAPNLAAKATP